jgi:peptidoglycan/LPS O-acetylase OafA/YrhL
MQITNKVRSLPRNISSLQAGRAVAAILVVLFHESVAIFALPKYWGTRPFGRLFDFGDSGVYFFFVLSGFIILHAHYYDLGRRGTSRYLYKRFVRIYPVYWIVLLSILPLYFIDNNFGYGFETRTEVILSSFFLIHFVSLHTIVAVAWTLFHETLFYGLFAIAIWNARLGLTVLLLWFVISALSMFVVGYGDTLGSFYFSNLHLLFGFGMAGAWYLRQRPVKLPAIVALLGICVFICAGTDQVHWHIFKEDQLALVYGLGSFLAIIGLVELERSGRLIIPALLVLLGDASYCIYLVHFFVLSILAKLIKVSGTGSFVPAGLAFIVLACLAITSGTLFHLWLERPMLAFLRRSRHTASVNPSSSDLIVGKGPPL